MGADIDSIVAASLGDCGDALIRQADERAAIGDWDAARSLYARAVEADPSLPTLISCGVFLAGRDAYEEAIVVLERAWDEARRQYDPRARAVCCGNLAILHRRRGDRARADQFHQLSLAATLGMAEFASECRLTTTQLRESAAQYLEQGEDEAAARLLAAARVSSDSQTDRLTIESGTAVLLARRGWIEQAAKVLFQSIDWYALETEREAGAHDLSNLGHLLQGMGRPREAAWCFRVSSGLFARSGAVVRSESARRFRGEAQRRAALCATEPRYN